MASFQKRKTSKGATRNHRHSAHSTLQPHQQIISRQSRRQSLGDSNLKSNCAKSATKATSKST